MEFTGSAPFKEAKKIYDFFVEEALAAGWKLQTGKF
jgi:D-Tyr-tRNAtyr deacylase